MSRAEVIEDPMSYSPLTTPSVTSPDGGSPIRPTALGGGSDPSALRRVRAEHAESPSGSMSHRGPMRTSRKPEHAGSFTARSPFRSSRQDRERRSLARPKLGPAYGSIYRRTEAPGPGEYDSDKSEASIARRAAGYSMTSKPSMRSTFIGKAEEAGKSTPGPGAHDTLSAFGRQPVVNKSKPSRVQRGGKLETAPSFSFGSASTQREATERVAYGSPRIVPGESKDGAMGSPRKDGSPTTARDSPTLPGSGTPRTTLARVGSTLARSVYLTKEHERENFGAHSPGPAVYSPKNSFTTTVGVKANSLRSTPSFNFGTSGRF